MDDIVRDIRFRYGIEKAEFVRDVLTVVYSKIKAKNLFGWKYYVNDVLVDLVGYIIATGFKYSGGAYVACGMQSALDHCRYCNAKKRRGNFESESLEALLEEKGKQPVAKDDTQVLDIYIDISVNFGDEFAQEMKPFLEGFENTLSKELLKKCRSKEFVKWFKEYLQCQK